MALSVLEVLKAVGCVDPTLADSVYNKLQAALDFSYEELQDATGRFLDITTESLTSRGWSDEENGLIQLAQQHVREGPDRDVPAAQEHPSMQDSQAGVTGSTPLWFKYQNRDAIHIDTEVSGTYDLRCLDPDTFNYVLLQLNGRGGLVESDGRTKHVLDGLKFRFPQRYGDTQDTAIHVTLPAPTPTPSAAPSDLGQAAQALVRLFGHGFSTTHPAIVTQQAARQGPIEPNAHGYVYPFGDQFRLVGMDAATSSFATALDRMSADFEGSEDAFRSSLHLLRYVGAPGTGKTTTIKTVPSTLLSDLESTGVITQTFSNRLQSWRTTQGPLVFHIDYGVRTEMQRLAPQEKHLYAARECQTILALRMLYATLAEQQQRLGYDSFLHALVERLPWWKELLPKHVCAYVQLAAGLKLDQPSIAIWTMDEINTLVDEVGPAAGEEALPGPWFRHVLSAAVVARQAMQSLAHAKAINMLLVFITASTRGAATSLHYTASRNALVEDLLLPTRMSLDDRKAVVMDVIRRLPLTDERRAQLRVGGRDQPFDEALRQQLASVCPEPVTELLYYCGSNPRAVAAGLGFVSGVQSGFRNQRLQVAGNAGAVECMWLDKPRSAVVDVLYQLTINSSVEAGFKKEYFAPETGQQSAMQRNMRHLLALCITGMKVSRNYDKNGCALQLLEADGLIELHEDTSYTGDSRPSSAHSDRTRKRSAAAAEPLEDEGKKQGSDQPDNEERLRVVLSPMMIIAAHHYMEPPDGEQRVVVKMIKKMIGGWRSREFSDLQLLMLRLQCWRVELKRQYIRVQDLCPSFRGHDLGEHYIITPESGYEEPVGKSMSAGEWVTKVIEASTTQGWHWLGSGHDPLPDSCVVLLFDDHPVYSKLVMNVQTKHSVIPGSASLSAIQEEADKVPLIQDGTIVQALLYVTDQHESRRSKMEWPAPYKGIVMCPIFWYQQEAIWGGAQQIRDVLWGPKRQRTG